ncbi:SDR family oxidoreductase [Deinococcus sp.]|uniref:SDR family NAD(P)-dependent oxidoreductase n=1 Tax=Deinococcus sp. TaxID=47478 RepID=UPI0025F577DE|nr:SDR family oxidoreductase [Deinococcus sp.]
MTTPQPSAMLDQSAPTSVRRPTALITGASGGLGEEMARQLAPRGIHLLLVARREDKLQALAAELAEKHGIQTGVMALDLADPGAAAELEREAEFRRIDIDFLINNAGYGLYGEFAHSDRTEQLDMLQLNIVTLTELTHRFLPGMLSRGRGRIMNVASTAAFLPGPLMATYYASKAFVLSFSEGLAEELRGSGVAVTALCPGPVETGFQDRASLGESVMLSGPSRFSVLSAQDVARQGLEAMMRGDAVCIPGGVNRAQLLMTKLMPRKYLPRLIHNVQRRK